MVGGADKQLYQLRAEFGSGRIMDACQIFDDCSIGMGRWAASQYGEHVHQTLGAGR